MKILLFLFSCLTIYSAAAQKKEDKFYVFDKEWKPAEPEKAAYLLIVRQPEQSRFIHIYYHMFGPMISQESFTEPSAKIPNGRCLYYYPDGKLDSAGAYVNGIPHGTWYFYNETGNPARKKEYDKGILVSDTLFPPTKEGPGQKVEPLPGEVESTFRGGMQGWVKFLTQNLNYPQRAMNAKITGMVRLQFIVDAEGRVEQPEINKSVEYSLDEEALRIIRKSPKWSPASKDGTRLKSYKIQPITFQFSR